MHRMLFSAALVVAVGSLGAVTGCGNTKTDDAKRPTKAADHSDHEDHEEGPHGGKVIELGDGAFHAELVHDDQDQSVTVYLLGADLKKPALSAEKEITLNITVNGKPQQFMLQAAPQEGDAAGESSRYQLKDAKLGEALDAPNNQGRLRVTIGGEQYSGAVEAHDHAEK
jgi:hypothetical protein